MFRTCRGLISRAAVFRGGFCEPEVSICSGKNSGRSENSDQTFLFSDQLSGFLGQFQASSKKKRKFLFSDRVKFCRPVTEDHGSVGVPYSEMRQVKSLLLLHMTCLQGDRGPPPPGLQDPKTLICPKIWICEFAISDLGVERP